MATQVPLVEQGKLDKALTLLRRRQEELAQFKDQDRQGAETHQWTNLTHSDVRDIFGRGSDQDHAFQGAFYAVELTDGYGDIVPGAQREIWSYVDAVLSGFVQHIEERIELGLQAAEQGSGAGGSGTVPGPSSRDVFVVHGHDRVTRDRVELLLRQLKLNPIVLENQPSKGQHVLGKVQANADVSFAVVLLTPDDAGGEAVDSDTPIAHVTQHRARQNVILELGFFLGKLGLSHVCALYTPGVELPGNYGGVVYVSLDLPDWPLRLGREIDAAGIDVDFNLLK